MYMVDLFEQFRHGLLFQMYMKVAIDKYKGFLSLNQLLLPMLLFRQILQNASEQVVQDFLRKFCSESHKLISTPIKEESKQMNKLDYDRALYYTHRSEWDNLLILMVRTKDQFLSKKIEHFLHAYNFEDDYSVIQKNLFSLLRYIDHANDALGLDENQIPLYSLS
jgi:hypothetical protein